MPSPNPSLGSASAPDTFTAWRLVKSRFARSAMTGEGAAAFGGRWNSPGVKVVYCAQSASLAMLELLVHLDDAAELRHYVMIPVRFSPRLVRAVRSRLLPRGWESPSPVAASQELGDAFVRQRGSAILAVPSVVVPHEFNFVINPAHHEFARVRVGRAKAVPCDERLAAMRRA